MRILVSVLLLTALGSAQSEPGLKFTCTEKEVEQFGLVCSPEEPCPVYLELTALEPVGARMFLTGNFHTVSNTLYGILLASEDGGKTWTEPLPRVRAAALEQIQFSGFELGWISGVKLEPLPRDPFLLLTTDGGKTWRERPLFEEQRYGSIQQFWFDTNKSGELIFDRSQGSSRRYERYESMTGGDSWEMKESSGQPLKLTRVRPRADSAWRIRTDAAAKMYRIERRGTDRWEPLSSFPIQIGKCE